MSGQSSEQRKIVLVGELNPFGADPRLALFHLPRRSSGNRLRRILGLTDVEYARIPKVNLCEGRWSVLAARDRARGLLADPGTGIYVLLGKKVRDVFRSVCGTEWLLTDFSTCADSGLEAPNRNFVPYTVVALPHPSGLCRTWNDPFAVYRTRDLLRECAPWVSWGGALDSLGGSVRK